MTHSLRLVVRQGVIGVLALAADAWRRPGGRALVALVLGSLLALYSYPPVEAELESLRFHVLNREPTGRILLVDIDGPSLRAIGRWPWPRAVYAEIIDRLLHLGAGEIAFDIDFSSPSSPDQDAALEEALKRANGTVVLAAHKQVLGRDSENRVVMLETRPLGRFAANGWEGSVNVTPEADGRVRWFPEGSLFARPGRAATEADAQEPIPALASILGEGPEQTDGRFLIDFGIDGDRLSHVSVADLLAGRVRAEEVSGRKIIVGANAVELRDFFFVPRFGMMSGSLLQAMAAESLLQHRALQRPPALLTIGISLGLLALVAWLTATRLLPGALVLCALSGAAVEAGAIAVQAAWPVVPSTASTHVGLLALATLCLGHEIRDRRLKLRATRRQADDLRRILDRVVADSFAGIVIVDQHGTIRAASAAAQRLLGTDDLTRKPYGAVLPPGLAALVRHARSSDEHQPAESIEVACRLKGDQTTILGCVVTISHPTDPKDVEAGASDDAIICLTFQDVTAQRRAQAELDRMARVDSVSGLANRYVLLESLGATAKGPTAHGAGLLLFDIDRFTTVNDRFGHLAGDALICAVAARLSASINAGDLAARLGGDEFAVAFSRSSEADALAMAETLRRDLSGLYELAGVRVHVTLSLGLGFLADGGAGDLLQKASAALHAAKHDGGDRLRAYDLAIRQEIEDGKLLEEQLREAIQQEAFSVVYQRQVDAHTGLIVGAEALVRWTHPLRGPVSPALFIPVAERTGLIKPLGAWVLRRACQDALSWPEPIKVSVNLSAVQLADADLADDIFAILAETKLPPSRLDLEMTESLLLEDQDLVKRTLAQLRQAGVRISLDDFGTGYSSLSYLCDFPVDKLKIDQSFVRALGREPSAAAIIRTAAGLGQELGLRVNIEGVETPEQLALVRLLGCEEIQGYLFGKPEPTAALSLALGRMRKVGADASRAPPDLSEPKLLAPASRR